MESYLAGQFYFSFLTLFFFTTPLDPMIQSYTTQKLTGLTLSRINPFAPNVPFLYPLKTSENRKSALGTDGSFK